MAFTLNPARQAEVDELLASGDYDGPDAVLEESLKLLKERDEKLRWLQAALAEGEADELCTIEWTPELMTRLMEEADGRSRLGLPIRDAVKPPA